LISYCIRSKEPFEIDQCSVASGAVCGAIDLTERFESLLRTRLGSHSREILTPGILDEAHRQFESSIKLSFNPYDNECESEYEISFLGAPDLPTLRLEEGFLTLTRLTHISLPFSK